MEIFIIWIECANKAELNKSGNNWCLKLIIILQTGAIE
jgi:hypothetical protein